MYTSAVAWAHVTLYYASFFAASALLEMFGCYANENKFIVEVAAGLTGSQRLELNTHIMTDLGIQDRGAHEKFWYIFYDGSSHIYPWVANPILKEVLRPGSVGETWQIETRNKVNYDTQSSITTCERFQRNFDPNQFPGCIQGELSDQLSTVDNMTRLAFSYARRFRLNTDALSALTSTGASRGHKIEQLILNERTPDLSGKISWTDFL
jgi:hypothetical protein